MIVSLHTARRAVLVSMAAFGMACGDFDSPGDATARGTTPVRPDFSISVAAGTETLAPGASATYTIATEASERDAQQLALSVTGLPAGVSAVLAPSTVNTGETALLELSAATTAAPAVATFTVTAVALKGSTRKATGQVNIVASSL
jgi:hypothetical protein